MTPRILVDAGPLVAVLHRDDRDHRPCVKAMQGLREPLLTTWMPVTEAMYLLEFSAPGQSALLEMIERGALQILELGVDDMPEVRALQEVTVPQHGVRMQIDDEQPLVALLLRGARLDQRTARCRETILHLFDAQRAARPHERR